MAIQKPGEWANSLLARFEDQVSVKHEFSLGFAQGSCIAMQKSCQKMSLSIEKLPTVRMR